MTTATPDQAAADACAADDNSKASADTETPQTDGSSAGVAQPELSPPAAPQGGRQRAEPDWFVGGRNGEDGFASCAPGRSFAASKASLMGSGSQGSRSAWLPDIQTLNPSIHSAPIVRVALQGLMWQQAQPMTNRQHTMHHITVG